MGYCTVPWCSDPEDTGCFNGCASPEVCPSHTANGKANTLDVAPAEGPVFPWTGNSLGHGSLEFLAGRTPTKLVGVVGASNAGKTTFLTLLYLLLSRGERMDGRLFAGSYSLVGWDHLAADLRMGSWSHPRFPQHTSVAAGRRPGLLHLAFRSETRGVLEDLVLTDAPGEWFTTWADDPKAKAAEGAAWIAAHARALVLLADSEALSGAGRGMATSRLRRLAERVGQHAAGRRIAVVWSKADHQVPKEVAARLRATFARAFPTHREFSVSAKSASRTDLPPLEEHLRIVEWLLEDLGLGFEVPDVRVSQHEDPFYVYSRHD